MSHSGRSAVPDLIVTNPVTDVQASPTEAVAHFVALLAFETDCWGVHEAMARPDPGFVLLDLRSPELFTIGDVPGAVSLPHRRINQRNLDRYPDDTLFVVYCAGPHCNGADKAAVRLGALGRSVEKMIGGIEGWKTRDSISKQQTDRVPGRSLADPVTDYRQQTTEDGLARDRPVRNIGAESHAKPAAGCPARAEAGPKRPPPTVSTTGVAVTKMRTRHLLQV